MAEAVDLLLPHDVGDGAARILDVLLAVEDLPHGFRLATFRVPDMDGEDHAAAARHVVEHRLDRRIGEDAAVPVELAVDTHGGEGRWKGAGRHDMAGAEFH